MTQALRVVTSARKGGCGKTVLTTLLGRELARNGLRVLVLDLDPQEVGAGARLGADISSPLQFTAVDLVRRTGRPFQAQIIASGQGRLEVVAGNQADLAPLEGELRTLAQMSLMATGTRRRLALDLALCSIDGLYDVVLVDTPTGFGEITTHALEAADLVLSPVDMRNAGTVESVKDLEQHLRELSRAPLVRFVPNMVVSTSKLNAGAWRRAGELCGDRLMREAAIADSREVDVAMEARRPLVAVTETAVRVAGGIWKIARYVIDLVEAERLPRGDGVGAQGAVVGTAGTGGER